jgi:hypothetical protein
MRRRQCHVVDDPSVFLKQFGMVAILAFNPRCCNCSVVKEEGSSRRAIFDVAGNTSAISIYVAPCIPRKMLVSGIPVPLPVF